MLGRRHFNVVTVAVANKMARIMWAMIIKGTEFLPDMMGQGINGSHSGPQPDPRCIP